MDSTASPKRLARVAGVFYLLLGVFGGFAQGFLEPKIYVAGDATATAANVTANAALVHAGFVAELLGQAFFVLVVLALYMLLEHVNKNMARAMLVFVALAVGITSLNAIFLLEALRVATGAVNLAALGTAGSNAMVLLLLDMQHYGIFVAQIFFGAWLIPLGYLAYKSAGMFPKWLGVLLIVAGVSYLLDLLAVFLLPDIGLKMHVFMGIIPGVAEITMVVYLLVFGVRSPRPNKGAPVAA